MEADSAVKKRWVLAVALILLVLFCAATGLGLAAFGPRNVAPTIKSIPIFPGATGISTGTLPLPPQSSSIAGQGSLDFNTRDSGVQVYAFYDKRMISAGWVQLLAPGSSATTGREYTFSPVPGWVPSWVPFLDRRTFFLSIDVYGPTGSQPAISNDPAGPNLVHIFLIEYEP
ncbi:MAG: hypothetical protein ACJ78Q_11880 [Chloroflexia bacterium]